MEYKGIQFYFKDIYEGKTGVSTYFACAKYESLLCPGRLIVRNNKVKVSLEHTGTNTVADLQRERDPTDEMGQYLSNNCLTTRTSAAKLWERAWKKMRENFGDLGSLKLLHRNTGMDLVSRLRKEATGGDVFRALETDHYRCVSAADKHNFKGFLGVLTVVPHDRIEKKAIRFVQTKLKGAVDMSGHKVKWDKFWAYFKSTWLGLYPASCWNISGMKKDGVPIVN
ncbi:hypothetical protein BBJ28_00005646 [Nothophytophthora sp. Chile5]|nr:hypothetical protein BBJ28_00005646 [Nothophytophthora sp. Chile5]